MPPQIKAKLQRIANAKGTTVPMLLSGLLPATATLMGHTTAMMKRGFGDEGTQTNLFSMCVAPPASGKTKAYNLTINNPLRKLSADTNKQLLIGVS